MRISVSGGGPAGLYFAILMKERNRQHEITVYEQNAAHTTYGYGIVLSGRAQGFLRDAHPASYDEIAGRMIAWDELTIGHDDERMRVDRCPFSGLSRIGLLDILQSHCKRLGIDVRYGTQVESLAPFAGADLVVAADGVNSAVRRLSGGFGTTIGKLSNRYIWYGVRHHFDTLSLLFRRSDAGSFVAHCYPYEGGISTFIVECTADTWDAVGFAQMSDAESRRTCAAIFANDIGGAELLSNNSKWLNFNVVTNERWVSGNTVVIGDAARTVHFSIGSGTRSALEDSITLADALGQGLPLADALARYEAARRPPSKHLEEVAQRSYEWYEDFPRHMALSPWEFAYSYMTRGGFVAAETLRQRSPRFMANYESAVRGE